jgi:DNA polymerase (family X)
MPTRGGSTSTGAGTDGLELGCLMSINPDAHSTSELDLTHWGVEMARKGWVPKTRVLNCLSLRAFSQYVRDRQPSPLWRLARG